MSLSTPIPRRRPALGLAVILASLGLSACSEVTDDPLPPSGPAARAHPTGWLTTDSDAFHGQAIRAADWSMAACQSCHGADYAGGDVGVTCLTCHSNTPESCTTCHGGVAGAGPPEDLSSSSSTGSRGVGAHQAHLQATITESMSCADCHVFAGYDDPAHIDGDGRAEVIFGARASAADATPEYDADTGSCADTYCHGGGRFGSGAAVVWSGGSGDQAACGTCHANPPSAETGHPNVPASLACSACHSDVVEVDEDDPTLIRIIDSSLHMNGETDL